MRNVFTIHNSQRLLKGLFAGLLFSALVVEGWAQAPSAAQMQRAFAQFGAQNYEGAIAILDSVVAATPGNAQAWTLLGRAYASKGDLEKAIGAYEKTLELPQSAPQGMFNLGTAYAMRGDLDQAFEWLFKAKETNQVNMTNIGISPSAAKLQNDPRYKKLFPTKAEFADPFVEKVKIIHDWHGEAPGDQYGWIARNIGDVDKDGVADVTTSAPTNNEGGQAAGKIYVYSGKSGKLIWEKTGPAGGRLGMGIEAAGDVNNDGVPDVIAGAPSAESAFVYSGNDGEILLTLKGEKAGDAFGGSVADLGDQNGDGYDDVIVGAASHGGNGQGAGAAYIYSGKDGSLMLKINGESQGAGLGSTTGGWSKNGQKFIIIGAGASGPNGAGRVYVHKGVKEKADFIIEADATGANLGGMFVSVLGDVDGDKTPDVYASDWANNALGRSTGRAYIHSGATGERIYAFTGEAAGDGFGIGVSDAGDVNGDGYADMLIGAWQQASAAPSGGKCYLYSGKDGSLMHTLTGKVPGETFGFDTTGMGDVDGDGTIDYLITSAWSAIKGTRSGRMFIVSGKIDP